jgi:ABC-type glutathione transport system ATPase component
MTGPLLQLDGVTKVYDLETRAVPRLLGRRRPLTAVSDVSFTVARGGVMGIVGESGSGKSTLARMVLGMEPPTAGTVRFDGQDLAGLRGPALTRARRRAQMVFQDPGGSLNPRKTVRRVLGESLGLAGVPGAERAARSAALLVRVGLGPAQLDSYPHELSGGQRQRVAIARALAVSPELVVADEPVSALDVSLQAQIIRLLLRLRDELGLTLLFISHDLALVHHMCDQVVVMQSGRVVERGTPAEVLHAPQHPYTRLLIDAVPAGPGSSPSRA